MKRPLLAFSAVFLATLGMILTMGGLPGLLVPGAVFLFCALSSGRYRGAGSLAVCAICALLAAYGAAEVFALRLAGQQQRVGSTFAFTGWVLEENPYNPAMLTLQAELEDGERVVLDYRCPNTLLEPGDWLAGEVWVLEARPRGGTFASGGITLYGVQEGELDADFRPGQAGVFSQLAAARHALARQVWQAAPGEASGVVAAMLFSTRDYLSQTFQDQLNRAGVGHLVVVSGLHLSILAGWMLALGNRLGLGRGPQTVLGLGAVWLVAGMAGFSVSVLRAAVMMTLWLAGRCLGKKADGLTSLAFAAFLLAALCPTVIFEGGFLLSFSATLGLVVGSKPLRLWLHSRWTGRFGEPGRLADWLLGGVAATVSAQLGALPVLALLFGYLTTWTILSNLLVMPFLTGVLVLGGLGAVCLSLPGCGAVGLGLLTGARAFGLGIVTAVQGISRLPWGVLPLRGMEQYALCFLASGLFFLCCGVRPGKKAVKSILLGSACFLVLALGYGGIYQAGAACLTVSADTGGVVLTSRAGTVVLDGGEGDYHRRMLSRQLLRAGAGPLEALVRPEEGNLSQDLLAAQELSPKSLWLAPQNLPLAAGQLPGVALGTLGQTPQRVGEAQIYALGPEITCLEIRGRKVLKLWAGYDIIRKYQLPQDTDLLIDREGRVYSLDPGLRVARLWNGDSNVILTGK